MLLYLVKIKRFEEVLMCFLMQSLNLYWQ